MILYRFAIPRLAARRRNTARGFLLLEFVRRLKGNPHAARRGIDGPFHKSWHEREAGKVRLLRS